jgi:hypothetical protein
LQILMSSGSDLSIFAEFSSCPKLKVGMLVLCPSIF